MLARPRFTYLVLTLATIALGLLARRFLPALPAKYAGVALYAVMMVWLVKLARPTLPRMPACVAALAICFAVEGLQATPIPARLCAHFPPLHYVLGEVFSWRDLPAYAAGVALAYLAMKGYSACAEGSS